MVQDATGSPGTAERKSGASMTDPLEALPMLHVGSKRTPLALRNGLSIHQCGDALQKLTFHQKTKCPANHEPDKSIRPAM